jgi:hypothetical protein
MALSNFCIGYFKIGNMAALMYGIFCEMLDILIRI